MRESIFNILSHSSLLEKKLDNCLILDLFSGIGSFGLEAISRGAAKVVFFDNYEKSINILKKNINILSFDGKAEIIKGDLYNQVVFDNLQYKFDIIFIDPPFKDEQISIVIDNIIKCGILTSKTLIIIHRKKNEFQEIEKKLKIIREEKYGLSTIFFCNF